VSDDDDQSDWQFFYIFVRMATDAIMVFLNITILTARTVKRVTVHHHTEVGSDRSNHC